MPEGLLYIYDNIDIFNFFLIVSSTYLGFVSIYMCFLFGSVFKKCNSMTKKSYLFWCNCLLEYNGKRIMSPYTAKLVYMANVEGP